MLLILAIAGVVVPRLQIWPTHAGATSWSMIRNLRSKNRSWPETRSWPEFPTRIAAGAIFATLVGIVLAGADYRARGITESWLVLAALLFLVAATSLWMRNAPALRDLAALPPAAFLVALAIEADGGRLYTAFRIAREPESAMPLAVTIICAMGVLGSFMLFWQSGRKDGAGLYRASLSALFAPLVVAVLEVRFVPVDILGAWTWALHAMAVAGVMVWFALQSARHDGCDRRGAALFAIAAMTMASLALVLVLSDVALTLALAMMVVLAAVTDRRFDMKYLSVFAQVGAVLVGGRLVFEPGIFRALYQAGLWEILLAYGGAIAALSLAWLLLAGRGRTGAIVVMESAVWTLSGVLASVLLFRYLDDKGEAFWIVSLFGTIWLISMANQLYRLKAGGRWMLWARYVLVAGFGFAGFALLGVSVSVVNPLVRNSDVTGPFVFDTLLVAYVLPAIVFLVIAWRFEHLKRWVRVGFGVMAAGLGLFYAALEIRRFWHGDTLTGHEVFQGELYSYTIGLLLISVVVLFVAFSRRSTVLRKVAVAGIALTIAKVFLVDMAGLTGLIRVASFLGLGLSLAGLAWVNRRMDAQWDTGGGVPPEETSEEG
jgi:uncharacterized membrane protein